MDSEFGAAGKQFRDPLKLGEVPTEVKTCPPKRRSSQVSLPGNVAVG